MLTPQDDLFGHQTPAPLAEAGASHPRFTERRWYTAHPIDGTPLIVDLGIGYYPNKGVMDAFAGVTIGHVQHNFRASRHLGGDPLTSAVGPLRFEVLEGHRRHRVTLERGNGSGLAFDLVFDAALPPAREKQSRRERDGVLDEDLARVAQFGRWSGWLEADGRRWDVTPETWWGQRDQSWGVRSEMRTDDSSPPVAVHKKFFWTWSMFQFEDAGVATFLKEREPGKPWYLSGSELRREGGRVVTREVTALHHAIEWADDPLGQSIATARWTFEFEHGAPREVRMECLPTRFYLKGGLYGGFKGWNHGDDKGPLHAEHDVWHLDDPATRQAARTLADHVVRLTSEGQIGWGISEYGVAAGYPAYEAPQRFPAM